mmetsp:Transcript_45704/g.92261  ORF Transcript_45704/g.92261 Transcript_45704/m.92261 type:complete len:219 (+) Transcript_45704:319-975(+)
MKPLATRSRGTSLRMREGAWEGSTSVRSAHPSLASTAGEQASRALRVGSRCLAKSRPKSCKLTPSLLTTADMVGMGKRMGMCSGGKFHSCALWGSAASHVAMHPAPHSPLRSIDTSTNTPHGEALATWLATRCRWSRALETAANACTEVMSSPRNKGSGCTLEVPRNPSCPLRVAPIPDLDQNGPKSPRGNSSSTPVAAPVAAFSFSKPHGLTTATTN